MRRANTGDALLPYGRVLNSLLYIFPLLILYQLGLLYESGRNGVDFVSQPLFDALDRKTSSYVYLHLGALAVFFAYVYWRWRRDEFDLDEVTPLILESSIYALTLGSFIVFVMDGLVGLDILAVGYPRLALEQADFGNTLVISLGAGVHEELLFRMVCMGLGSWLLTRAGLPLALSVFLAAVASSLLFAIAHHIGGSGEAFNRSLFAYRSIAGMGFAAIFYYRSLAHAAYCHVLYDLYVISLA